MENDLYTMTMEEYGIKAIPDDISVAMAYVPYQTSNKTFSAEQGAVSGTMFPVLKKPFVGCEGE